MLAVSGAPATLHAAKALVAAKTTTTTATPCSGKCSGVCRPCSIKIGHIASLIRNFNERTVRMVQNITDPDRMVCPFKLAYATNRCKGFASAIAGTDFYFSIFRFNLSISSTVWICT